MNLALSCPRGPSFLPASQARTFRLRGFAANHEDKMTTRSFFWGWVQAWVCSNMLHPPIYPPVIKGGSGEHREHREQMEVSMEKNTSLNEGMFPCHIWLPAGRWIMSDWKLFFHSFPLELPFWSLPYWLKFQEGCACVHKSLVICSVQPSSTIHFCGQECWPKPINVRLINWTF